MPELKTLEVEKTTKTPELYCDSGAGLIKITGNCIPEDAIGFFLPLKEWLETYSTAPKPKTEIRVRLNYFNTSTARLLLNLFKMLMVIQQNGNEILIIWEYEEDDWDMREAGEDYKVLLGDSMELKSF